MTLRVVISTSGKFHSFDLARQLQGQGMLQAIFTGYPRFKLADEGLPEAQIRSFPAFSLAYNAAARLPGGRGVTKHLAWLCNDMLDRYVSAVLPPCDVFVGLSGTGLHTGQVARRRGGVYICDRGSSHIRYQDRLLREEYRRYGLEFAGIDLRLIAKEEAEYAAADQITVASTFVKRSFLEMGVPEAKISVVAYGVSLTRFQPVGSPDSDTFDVLFVGGASLRKGIRYLLKAFENLNHPRKRLTFAGRIAPEVQSLIEASPAQTAIICLGHVAQPKLKEVMSRSHVLALPSIEEGLALVQAQAMACGCPVIGTTNSGAEDLLRDGLEGYVLPIRDSESLTERLQGLADNPELRSRMSQACLSRVQSFGGWDSYGTAMAALFTRLYEAKQNVLAER